MIQENIKNIILAICTKEESLLNLMYIKVLYSLESMLNIIVKTEMKFAPIDANNIGSTYRGSKNEGKEFGYYMSTNPFLITILNRLKIKSMLDLGSGCGLVLKAISCFNHDIKVHGIENDEEYVKIAKSLCVETLLGDIIKLKKKI